MAKVALLIGVGNYEHPDALKPLVSAPKDVAAMQRILQNAQMGEFSEVIPLIDPDPMQMQEAIETLYRDRAKDDLVLLFFSGHGIKDDSGRLHFATRLTRKTPKGDLIQSTAVSARFVQEIMGKSRSRRQVMILDCCFSGAFDPALNAKDDGSLDVQGQLGAEGRVVLTSSSSTQYSFEQQGSDLSIYTRFLVEGIETGAADRDNDGKVSVQELHEYATQKVQETAPTMNPKIIVLKDEGFDVVFAKAQITDPNLKYRKEAERYSMRGEISLTGRALLNALRERLGVTREEAQEIEEQVLQPFRERLKRIEDYRSAFVAEAERQYPLTQETLSELKDLREILGLRKEDVTPVEQEVISQIVSKSEVYRHSLQRYEQEFTRAIQSEYPLSQPVSESLNKFQADLGLIDEDVAQIKRPILERRAAEDRQPQLEPQKPQDTEKARQPNEEVQKLQPESRQGEQQPTPPQHRTVRSSNKVLLVGACLSSILIAGGLFYFNSTHPQSLPDVQKSPSPSITPTPIASLPSSPKPVTSPSSQFGSTNTPVSSLPTPTPSPNQTPTPVPIAPPPPPTPTAIPSNELKYRTVQTRDGKVSMREGTKTTSKIIAQLKPGTVVFCGDTKEGDNFDFRGQSSKQWMYCKKLGGFSGFIHSLLLDPV
ncbi:caspase family protein [Phormidium sp. FACHB-592]|uniref:Caspase family protein n=1 Tax=Stenomitos frigidus AS-A4 TaxID=2933935 RepID=A0ABV0KRY9_9CYAN|nr:caspase family protein [Phormidium sp. FACHB-592]MBD2075465.1 caspase family protein [Phormidium sp. FACHB-592]